MVNLLLLDKDLRKAVKVFFTDNLVRFIGLNILLLVFPACFAAYVAFKIVDWVRLTFISKEDEKISKKMGALSFILLVVSVAAYGKTEFYQVLVVAFTASIFIDYLIASLNYATKKIQEIEMMEKEFLQAMFKELDGKDINNFEDLDEFMKMVSDDLGSLGDIVEDPVIEANNTFFAFNNEGLKLKDSQAEEIFDTVKEFIKDYNTEEELEKVQELAKEALEKNDVNRLRLALNETINLFVYTNNKIHIFVEEDIKVAEKEFEQSIVIKDLVLNLIDGITKEIGKTIEEADDKDAKVIEIKMLEEEMNDLDMLKTDLDKYKAKAKYSICEKYENKKKDPK